MQRNRQFQSCGPVGSDARACCALAQMKPSTKGVVLCRRWFGPASLNEKQHLKEATLAVVPRHDFADILPLLMSPGRLSSPASTDCPQSRLCPASLCVLLQEHTVGRLMDRVNTSSTRALSEDQRSKTHWAISRISSCNTHTCDRPREGRHPPNLAFHFEPLAHVDPLG